jgi:lysophospholipid acyltransferase (LPLAT)-like uncharacterized protein
MPQSLPNRTEEVFEFAGLGSYSRRQRFLIRVLDGVFYILIGLTCGTVRYEVEGWENFEKIEADGKIPIYSFWHNRIFLGTYFWRNRKIVVMTSQSFDGEYIARFIQRFGYGAVRGSSTRGGVGALVNLIRCMKRGMPAAFALDGPKGPRYVVKTGALLLAKKTGNPLMPFVFEPRRFTTINSWDKLQIPLPFTRAKLLIAEPVYVDKDSSDAEIEVKALELQAVLDQLVLRGEEWRNTKN